MARGASTECRVVVRPARDDDEEARVALRAVALADTRRDAFFYFLFQELMLEVVVLCGAVLFIFCGVSVAGCLLVLPLTAGAVYISVWMYELAIVNQYRQQLRAEDMGWVAEMVGDVGGAMDAGGAGGPPRPVLLQHELSHQDYSHFIQRHRVVVGDVSVCSSSTDYWLRGLGASGVSVGGAYRQRVVWGLVRAVAEAAVGTTTTTTTLLPPPTVTLHIVTSCLQHDLRNELHAHGWVCSSTYHRRVLGDALTLPMAHLVKAVIL